MKDVAIGRATAIEQYQNKTQPRLLKRLYGLIRYITVTKRAV